MGINSLQAHKEFTVYFLPQRERAARVAIAVRRAADSFLALARPPFAPPSFPKATAGGFFPAFRSSSGVPSKCSPMACSTTRRATVAKSWFLGLLERLDMLAYAMESHEKYQQEFDDLMRETELHARQAEHLQRIESMDHLMNEAYRLGIDAWKTIDHARTPKDGFLLVIEEVRKRRRSD